MDLVSKIFGTRPGSSQRQRPVPIESLADGALDTLGSVIRTMGDESFPLEQDTDPAAFPALCAEFARHVENGAAVPSFDIRQTENGARQWGRVRRFFADRRHAEKSFVIERLQDYRAVIDDLVAGLRDIGERDQLTETSVRENLQLVENAVSTGALPKIKDAFAHTVANINETFARQKEQYELQLQELNQRISILRQDLLAAREEMKRDALTDAYNRGAFDSAIAQSFNMHFIMQQAMTLVMVDLDNFKEVNDTHGHSAGDEVLRAVGDCLARSFIRKSDFVARYGGDEFAVILPDTPARQCDSLIHRFLENIRSIDVPSLPGAGGVACSAGYTEIAEGDTVAELIDRADKALYEAKKSGRDRAVFLPAASPGESA